MADKSQNSKENKKKAFIISPIGDKNTDFRFRFEGLFALVYKPVLDDLGYDCEPIVNELRPGSIFSQIMDHLLNDDLVICDLTYNNPNVMYELSIRHIIRKPVVMIIGKSKDNFKIPFDIREDRIFEFPNNPSGYAELKNTLPDLIKKAMLNKEEISNPITRHIDLKNIRISLEASGNEPLKLLFNEVIGIKDNLSQLNAQINMRERKSIVEILADNAASKTINSKFAQYLGGNENPDGISSLCLSTPSIYELDYGENVSLSLQLKDIVLRNGGMVADLSQGTLTFHIDPSKIIKIENEILKVDKNIKIRQL